MQRSFCPIPRVSEFARNCEGSSTFLFAFGLVALCAAGAIGVDYARATAMRQFLANAADAAALAAVARLPDTTAARDTALEYVEKNMPQAKFGSILDPGDIEIGFWDRTTRAFTPAVGQNEEQSGNAIRITTRMAESAGTGLSTMFARVLGINTLDLSSNSIAGRGGPPCVIALDAAATTAMLVGVTAKVIAEGCGVQVDATSSSAMVVSGAASVSASDVCVAGQAAVGLTSSVDPEPREYCLGQSDPLAGLGLPMFGGCQHYGKVIVGLGQEIDPGVYCGGLTIAAGASVELSPGTYVIRDGPLTLLGAGAISGQGVTFFLTGTGAVVNFAALSSLDLTAPTQGDLAGILFFQDPDTAGTHIWLGTSTANLQGVIYFPSGNLLSQSATRITPQDSCTVLIANSIEFLVNSGVSIDVTGADCRGALPGPYRRGIVLLQ